MFPLRDLERTRTTALVTLVVIALNILAYLVWQPHESPADVEFLYEHAAVACELTTGGPVSIRELESGECRDSPIDAPVFPDKQLALSVAVSMFLHGGLLHLLGNMWFLWIFGDNVEEAFGHIGYLLLYVVGGVVATLGFVFLHRETVEPLIGASGAVAAVLGAYCALFPKHRVLSLWFLGFIPIPAIIFLGIWFVGQFGVADTGVAWEAHVAGFLFGVIAALVLRGPLQQRLRRLHAPGSRAPIW